MSETAGGINLYRLGIIGYTVTVEYLAGELDIDPTSAMLAGIAVTSAAYGGMNAIQGNLVSWYQSRSEGRTVVDGIITDGSHLENGRLKPNVVYKTGEHDYIYKTNEDGFIVNASTDNLQLKIHEGRLNHNPNTYGKEIGDHAGHLYGDRFGGSPELDNLVSQSQKVNLSEFKVIENQWANALKRGQRVTANININYDVGGARPVSFDISYTIDDIPFFQRINN